MRYVDTLSRCPECEQHAIDSWQAIVHMFRDKDDFYSAAKEYLEYYHQNEHSTIGLFAMEVVSW